MRTYMLAHFPVINDTHNLRNTRPGAHAGIGHILVVGNGSAETVVWHYASVAPHNVLLHWDADDHLLPKPHRRPCRINTLFFLLFKT